MWKDSLSEARVFGGVCGELLFGEISAEIRSCLLAACKVIVIVTLLSRSGSCKPVVPDCHFSLQRRSRLRWYRHSRITITSWISSLRPARVSFLPIAELWVTYLIPTPTRLKSGRFLCVIFFGQVTTNRLKMVQQPLRLLALLNEAHDPALSVCRTYDKEAPGLTSNRLIKRC